GTIAAASQLRKLAIGIDRDEYQVAPNAVISSVVERMDVVVARVVEAYAAGHFLAGESRVGPADGGVTLAPFRDFSSRVSPALRQALGRAAA
ncbi:MAG: BMP family ABC transporter substrate-binding protein, partial [Chloroflexota bacterium]